MIFRVGITGGIGCGKSYVARLIERRGFPVYDCDSRAKMLMDSDPLLASQLEQLTGLTLYAEGHMDRALLASFLFDGPENAARINALVHPRVRDDFRTWCSEQDSPICFIESAILYESGFDSETDAIVTVDAPLQLRLERAVKRDSSTEQKIRSRMDAQMAQEEKVSRADFIIVNDNERDLQSQIDSMLSRMVRIILNR